MNPRTRIALALPVVLLLVVVAASLALHFLQKSHNRMQYSLDEVFPPGQETVPGEIVARTLWQIMDHELNAPFGWRPNDFFLWGPRLWADNNASRQMGIIQGIRETTRVFRDNLTKLPSEEFDANLRLAETMFRNDPEQLKLPAAERQFARGVKVLKDYVAGLNAVPPASRPLNLRNVELIKLFEAWAGLLGDAHANLYRTRNPDGSRVTFWQSDNLFYEAQGNALVMYWMIKAVGREYEKNLTASLVKLFHEVEGPLAVAAMLKPIIVLEGSPAGITANHRRNLDAFVSEARNKMLSIIEELKK